VTVSATHKPFVRFASVVTALAKCSSVTSQSAYGDDMRVYFAPSAGRNFTDPHYAVVISTRRFSKATRFCIVPQTTTKYHHEQRLENKQLKLQLLSLRD